MDTITRGRTATEWRALAARIDAALTTADAGDVASLRALRADALTRADTATLR